MAIEQFVKHIENLHDQHCKYADDRNNRSSDILNKGPIKSVSHLNSDLMKLKDMLKQVMTYKSSTK